NRQLPNCEVTLSLGGRTIKLGETPQNELFFSR
ncbi:MAG: hypothetical protein ACI9E1_001263, partial [Cryomorphaceae bacterium]